MRRDVKSHKHKQENLFIESGTCHVNMNTTTMHFYIIILLWLGFYKDKSVNSTGQENLPIGSGTCHLQTSISVHVASTLTELMKVHGTHPRLICLYQSEPRFKTNTHNI